MTPLLQSRWFRVIFVLVWLGLLIAWTKALLMPVPAGAKKVLGGEDLAFLFGKTLHVGVYAILAILTLVLPFPRRWRIGLLIALVLHGGATEFLQQFVQRGSSLRDVGLDTLGVLIGTALGCYRPRRRAHSFGKPPQVEPQPESGQEHQNTADLG